MTYKISAITLLLFIFSLSIYGQDRHVNCIIQVNKELVNGDLADIRIIFSDNPNEEFEVDYIPGELRIPEETYLRLIDRIDTTSANLHFDYYSYRKNGKQDLVNWRVNLSPILFEQPYLILNIYDFRDKAYKNMYSYHTTDDYIFEWDFPGSGILIPMKK